WLSGAYPIATLTRAGGVPTVAAPNTRGGAHGPDDHPEEPRALQGPREPDVGALRRAPGAGARALPRGAREHSGRRPRLPHGESPLSRARRRSVRQQLLLRAVGHALRSEEHTSELQSRFDLVCRLLLEKKNK